MSSLPHIALTGGTGHTGRWILKALLEQGYSRIRCLTRRLPAPPNNGVEWVKGDLSDPFSLEDFLEGVDVLIHAAGMESYRFLDKARLFEVNAKGTGHLVNAALYKGVGHFIHVSSAEALGRHPLIPVLDEQVEWVRSPLTTPFAESRYEAELEVWRGMQEGLSVSVLQPVMILDPSCRHRLSRLLIRWVEQQRPWFPLGSGCFVDVRDLADFVVERVAAPPCGERILVGAENLSFRDLLTKLAMAGGYDPPQKQMARRWAGMVALWNRLTGGPGMHPQEVRLAFQTVQYDTALSRERYGCRYRDIGETLADMWRGAGDQSMV